LIQHRAPDAQLELVKRIMSPLKSRFVEMTYEEHDQVTANTQAVTHAAFLSFVKHISLTKD
jgi:prephenate dehydrogenase (NADP+)